ncbi:hypothetical protein [Halostella sp. PRR32]|uniref:hypothetical protein n=1 Tax=Halostella sp. PRR32 TaxID=3098147 RepID=UPI002B1D1618|nr:hypothetical protein [Halostella sp. PRR32]
MDFEIDDVKILYGLGVLFGLGALVYFGRDLVFELSVPVKSLLLLLGFVAFFTAASAIDRPTLDSVLYVLSGGAYLMFLGYTIDRYDVGDTGVFLALVFSSMLFIGLGYLLREREAGLPWRQSRYVLAVVAVVAGLLIVADLLGGGVVYTAALENEVTSTPDDPQMIVGTVTAKNEFVGARKLSPPSVSACVYTPDRRDSDAQLVWPDDYSYATAEVIGGGEEVELDIRVWHRVPGENNETAQQFTVERAAECPDETSVTEPTVVVVLDESVGTDRR